MTKCSCVKSFHCWNHIISNITWLRYFYTIIFSSSPHPFPSSNAAFKVIAFCNPIPLTCIKSLIEDFFNSFRFEADLSSSLLMSMLENPFLPVLINIANNSVFERLLHHGLTNVLLAFLKLPFL